MKRIFATYSAILFVFVSLASSASPPGSYLSNIDGVGLWSLYSHDNSSAGMTLEGEPTNTFVEYCNGKNKIYIYEIDSRGYICEAQKTYEEYEGRQIFYGSYITVKGLSEKLNGVYTVSKYPIKKKGWKFESLDNTEAASAREAAKKYSTKIDRGDSAYDNKSALGLYKKYEGKISVGMKEVLIVPTKYSYWQTGNEDLASSVVVNESDSYRAIGHIDGCLERLADIDGDGIPEVMTKTCISGGSMYIDYWKIFPEVKLLVRQSGG